MIGIAITSTSHLMQSAREFFTTLIMRDFAATDGEKTRHISRIDKWSILKWILPWCVYGNNTVPDAFMTLRASVEGGT
jgi:hypothetical protein